MAWAVDVAARAAARWDGKNVGCAARSAIASNRGDAAARNVELANTHPRTSVRGFFFGLAASAQRHSRTVPRRITATEGTNLRNLPSLRVLSFCQFFTFKFNCKAAPK